MAISGYPSTQNLGSNSLLPFTATMVYLDYKHEKLFSRLGVMTVDPFYQQDYTFEAS
jgi:hypothetical protein